MLALYNASLHWWTCGGRPHVSRLKLHSGRTTMPTSYHSSTPTNASHNRFFSLCQRNPLTFFGDRTILRLLHLPPSPLAYLLRHRPRRPLRPRESDVAVMMITLRSRNRLCYHVKCAGLSLERSRLKPISEASDCCSRRRDSPYIASLHW